jgi:hypothetical protein
VNSAIAIRLSAPTTALRNVIYKLLDCIESNQRK